MKNYTGKITIIYDGMWGSCGKGKVCGEIARKNNFSVAVNNNAPNAGHTFVFDSGEKVITKHIPIAFVNKNIPYLVIGESSVIDFDRLVWEINTYKHILNGRKLYICDTASVILPKHKQIEKEQIKSGSTYSGSGSALVDKIMRKSPLVKNDERFVELEKQGLIKIVDSKTFFPMIYAGLGGFKGNENILVELSQGDALSLNNSANYPYTTSRDCTPAQALKDIHATDYSKNVKKICVFRPYPIRINNVGEAGYAYTGNFEGARELSWEEVCSRANLDAEKIKTNEHTTVTKRLRRVGEFSISQFAKMLLDTRPDACYLNFGEYVNGKIAGLTNDDTAKIQHEFKKLNLNVDDDNKIVSVCEQNWALEQILGYIEQMENYFNDMLGGQYLNIMRIGTGAKESEYIDKKYLKIIAKNTHAYNDLNPLDYADKTNIPHLDL